VSFAGVSAMCNLQGGAPSDARRIKKSDASDPRPSAYYPLIGLREGRGVNVLGFVSALARGGRGRRGPQGAADDLAAPTLLSDFEVSRAIGVSVEGVRAPGVRARPGRSETAYHPLRGGERLLEASVLAGRAGRAALRAHRRRGRPLSHAGDLAYSGDGWVLGRRGDVVVLLRQHHRDGWRVIGGLPWLLATALDRVPTLTNA
jgi:hypothetical protein